MKGSLYLGNPAGIKVQIHWTFLLLIGWVVMLELLRGSSFGSILWSITFVLVLFACVVFHEFGHALTARRYGIKTRQITLLPIGGVASLEDLPEDPKEELLVAVAGPAVNVVIALILYLFVPVEQFINLTPEELQEALGTINASNFFFFLLSANIILVLFNIIPAFPMDGGRVLRALLSMKLDRVRATQIAALLGQGVAFMFFFIGLFYNPILILIAIFVFFGAQGENIMVQQLTLLRGHKVKDAMMTDISVLNPDDTLDDVIQIILSGTERDFIVAEEDEVQGVVYQSQLVQSIKDRDRQQTRVREIMDKETERVQAGDDLTEVYRKIRTNNKTFFPVYEAQKLVGAIDMSNINEFIVFRASYDY